MIGVSWPYVPLSEVARLTWRGEVPEPGKSYRLAGVSLWGRGISIRETIDGTGTNYSQLFRIEEGDIVVNKIWARNGSLSVAGAEVAGAYGSPEFPTYVPNRKLLDPRWAYWFTRSPDCWRQCNELSRGTSGQNRLKPERFLEVHIPLPPLSEQHRILAQLDSAAKHVELHRRATSSIGSELDATLASAFQQITANAPRACMGDIAPLVRREVTIDPDATYPELGIRSHGKGTFHKQAIPGIEIGSKRLFLVKQGDLVLNIVFAWEGAVAIATPIDDGRFGSHRFLTCVPDPSYATVSFLRYALLTTEGLHRLGEASPGGAGRNRTLGLQTLARLEVPLPSLGAQDWFNDLQERVGAARECAKSAETNLGALLPSLIQGAFKKQTKTETALSEFETAE